MISAEEIKARIVSAAVLYGGVIHSIPKPARHHDILHASFRSGNNLSAYHESEQGFLDSHGNFLDRKTAAIRAKETGQLTKDLIAPPNLYSEDLW